MKKSRVAEKPNKTEIIDSEALIGSNSSISELIKLEELKQKHFIEKHSLIMVELEFQRESERLAHERELERGRIKSSEIRKMHERKEAARYMNEYRSKK